MLKYTKTDIISHSKGNLYVPKGVQVTLTHTSGHVAFIEYLGEVYPCRLNLLGNEPPPVEQTKRKLSPKEAQLIEDYLKAKR